ncbi:MAG: EAL domain-containing protein [Granulosicoccus sp.]
MLRRVTIDGQASDRVALKDERLVYRACSLAFARSLGRKSPDDIIGKTDFDLFPGALAREQMALDSQAIFSAKAEINAIDLSSASASGERVQAMIVRTPVIDEDAQVRGIDIRLLGGPVYRAPKSAVTIDYQTLVNDGIQGSLIFARRSILFANDNAARVLGYTSAQSLIDHAQVADIFTQDVHEKAIEKAVNNLAATADTAKDRVTLMARSKSGGQVKLIASAAHVQWGASRALLLSFVDVSLVDEVGEQLEDDKIPEVMGAHNSLTSLSVKQVDDWRRLRSNEQRYRHYASAAADFFWETDAKLTFRVVSDGLALVLGIPREHILGRTHAQLLDHPANINDESHWINHLQQLEDAVPFRDFEFRWSTGGETRVVRYSGIPVFNRSRQFVGYRGVGCDVTTSVRLAETTAYHANHDALTGIVNRRSFENTVREALEASRHSREAHALCFMDLDSFKIVNDTCGHQAGDELLRQLTQLFDSLVRKSDVLARLGGDEFGVLLYKCSVPEALKLANQIRHEVENFHFIWDENRFSVGVSIGLVVVDDRWESIESLFSAVDSACYIAKDQGRNRVVVYREGEGNNSNRKIATHWVEEINTALEAGRLRLAAQKILPLHDQADGLRFEMFLRLEMPNGDLISPHAFLPTAERYGLVSELDERAIALTIGWLSSNPALQHSIRHVSINLSAASCINADFSLNLMRTITDSDVEPAKLCFEISETIAIANLSKVRDFMDVLSDFGCRFSIDGFGSGLSSFAFLKRLPIDFLKIDGLLVKNILADHTDFTMVKAISDISKSMGKRTVAEFIETPGLLDAVRDIGIDFGQGYHLGEPELIS